MFILWVSGISSCRTQRYRSPVFPVFPVVERLIIYRANHSASAARMAMARYQPQGLRFSA